MIRVGIVSGLPHRSTVDKIELTLGYFQITRHAASCQAATRRYSLFWLGKADCGYRRLKPYRYLGTALHEHASNNIKPGLMIITYIRSRTLATGIRGGRRRASDDAEGYLGFFQRKITNRISARSCWK